MRLAATIAPTLIASGLAAWAMLYLWREWALFALLLSGFLLSGGFLIFPKGKPYGLLAHGIFIGIFTGMSLGTAWWIFTVFS